MKTENDQIQFVKKKKTMTLARAHNRDAIPLTSRYTHSENLL